MTGTQTLIFLPGLILRCLTFSDLSLPRLGCPLSLTLSVFGDVRRRPSFSSRLGARYRSRVGRLRSNRPSQDLPSLSH